MRKANHQFGIHSDFLLVNREILWLDMLHVSNAKKVCTYSSHKTSTSNLLKHKCRSESGSSLLKIFIKKYVTITRDMKTAVTQFVTTDIRAFKVVSGEGFLAYSQCLINMGAKHGEMDAHVLIPHFTTLAWHAALVAEEKRKFPQS
ncbi:unnamed protein product [Lepidochelys kempii]